MATYRKQMIRTRPAFKRRLAGLLLLALGLIMATALALSGRVWFGYSRGTWGVGVQGGVVVVLYESGRLWWMPSDGWAARDLDPDERGYSWVVPARPGPAVWSVGAAAYYDADARTGRKRWLDLVAWPLAALTLVCGGALIWAGKLACRRAEAGQCKGCGYSLAGLADGTRCPECGGATGAAYGAVVLRSRAAE